MTALGLKPENVVCVLKLLSNHLLLFVCWWKVSELPESLYFTSLAGFFLTLKRHVLKRKTPLCDVTKGTDPSTKSVPTLRAIS